MFDVKGEQAQWAVIYDRLTTMNIGDQITDKELFELLPDAPETSVRGAFWHAVRQIEDDHQRTFDRIRLTGYRMIAPAEHERLARGQHKKAKRRMRSAWRKAHSADRSLLTQTERRQIDAIELHLSQQRDMIRRLDRGLKVERQERKAETAGLAERVDKLTDLLARHGITDHDAAPV